jgi:hypothetical protein
MAARGCQRRSADAQPMRATSLGEFWLGDNGDALNIVFAYLPIVYGLAASQPEFNVRF